MNTLEIRTAIHDQDDRHIYVAAEVLIDGNPIADFRQHVASFDQLIASTKNSGEFKILTCTCGEPSCAGITDGIKVSHAVDTVHWDLNGAGATRKLTFHSQAYRTAIASGLRTAKEQFAKVSESAKLKVEAMPYGEEQHFGAQADAS